MTGPPPPRSRGTIALLEENCTVCLLCVRECPDWCIEIDAHPEERLPPGGGRARRTEVLDRFTIDFGLCLYCGICVDVCPADALFWSPALHPAARSRAGLRDGRDLLREALAQVPPPAPHDLRGEPAKEAGRAAAAGFVQPG